MTLHTVVAHQSGDGITIAHCPFCGSGQVIGRSDGNTECSFCNQSFLVRVQPMFSAFPQSIDGMPVQIPGMPPPTMPGMPPGGDPNDPNAMPPGAEGPPGADAGGAPPFGGGSDSSDSGSDSGGSDGSGSDDKDSGGGPPFGKKESVYRVPGGRTLGRSAYVDYLAGLLGGQQ
ncbi:hypothetical protein FNV58_01300 (plasmid) [Streptomyces sp. RLB1-9]|uniref:hypothetical protein n=1 Tax=Streptomyces sp. RLB1-9 TaxID=2594454 RepID=UPI001165508A|nr:hypothetical protein [Streptomyces sp. RLB1-9]QDN94998.1 hypothetical protein FNV58_01300 [Streptomyces sp. RLB1-9]